MNKINKLFAMFLYVVNIGNLYAAKEGHSEEEHKEASGANSEAERKAVDPELTNKMTEILNKAVDRRGKLIVGNGSTKEHVNVQDMGNWTRYTVTEKYVQTIIGQLDSATIAALHDATTLLFICGFEHIPSNVGKLNDAILKFNQSIANRQDQFKHLLMKYNHSNHEYTVAYNQYIISSMFFLPNKAEIEAITKEVLPSFYRQNHAVYDLDLWTDYSSILWYHGDLGRFDAVLDVLLDLNDHGLAITKDGYKQFKQQLKATLGVLHDKYKSNDIDINAKRETIHQMRLALIKYFESINGLSITDDEHAILKQALEVELTAVNVTFEDLRTQSSTLYSTNYGCQYGSIGHSPDS